MKMLKKLAALILAATMVLVLFTAWQHRHQRAGKRKRDDCHYQQREAGC